MTTQTAESRSFEADVSRLLHMMVHSVYSDRDVFLRELISNAADASEKLRYEAIARPELLGDDLKLAITIAADPEAGTLVIADNGLGMSRDEMIEALGTIARSGTKSSAVYSWRPSARKWTVMAGSSYCAATLR